MPVADSHISHNSFGYVVSSVPRSVGKRLRWNPYSRPQDFGFFGLLPWGDIVLLLFTAMLHVSSPNLPVLYMYMYMLEQDEDISKLVRPTGGARISAISYSNFQNKSLQNVTSVRQYLQDENEHEQPVVQR